MAEQPQEYAPESTSALALPLLLQRLRDAPTIDGGSLPLPRDKRLLKVCEMLLSQPSSTDTLDIWSDRATASARTLSRLYASAQAFTAMFKRVTAQTPFDYARQFSTQSSP